MGASRGDSRPLSLTARVMLFVGLAIGVSLLMIGHLVHSAVERHFVEQDADELAVIARAVARRLHGADHDSARLKDMLSRAVSGHHGVYFQVWDQTGDLVYGPRGAEWSQPINGFAPVATIEADNLQRWQLDGKTYRGAVTRVVVDDRTYRIVTAIDIGFHIHFLESFRRSLWLIMLLAGAITLLAAWYGVYQGHAPLRGLSEAMRGVQADRLHVRLDPKGVPRELQSLVDAFNHMIGRLEDSFTRLSHFSADIAHELRTPLTNLITQTQVALGKPRTLDEYRELLYSNLEEQERVARMVNDMLWLAKSEHGLLKPVWESLDLAQEVRELFDFFEALAEERQVALALEGKAPRIRGDRGMLRRAMSNLLSNGLRYTPAGQTLVVRLARAEEVEETLAAESAKKAGVLLSVENPGPAIPAEHLPKLFDRFYRVDPSRRRSCEGTGLGLAITKSIVEAHGGQIAAHSDQEVTRFTLRLPLKAAER